MTEQELDELRLRLRVIVLEMAVCSAMAWIDRIDPQSRQSFLQSVSEFRDSYAEKVALFSSNPAVSDFLNSEAQDVFDSVIEFLRSC